MDELDLFDTAPQDSSPVLTGRTVFVDFDGGQVAVVLVDGEPMPVLRAASDDLGLKWSGQHEKIKADPAICVREIRTQMPGDDQARTVITTDLDGFVLWLAKINANKVSADARDLVITWQRKAARAIRERFFGKVHADPAAQVEVPTDYETALVHLLASVRERKALEAARAAEAPLVEQALHHRSTRALTAIGDFANDLQAWVRDEGINAHVLHDDVRDFLGYLRLIIRGNTVRNNCPQAEAIKAGYVRPHNHDYGTSARLTRKGVGYAWDRITPHIKATGSARPPAPEQKGA